MNRVKREIRKRGIKLSMDYPWLPYYIKGKSCFETGNIFVDDVYFDSTKATAVVVYNTIIISYTLTRSGEIEENWH